MKKTIKAFNYLVGASQPLPELEQAYWATVEEMQTYHTGLNHIADMDIDDLIRFVWRCGQNNVTLEETIGKLKRGEV